MDRNPNAMPGPGDLPPFPGEDDEDLCPECDLEVEECECECAYGPEPDYEMIAFERYGRWR